MKAKLGQKHPLLKDVFSFVGFVIAVILGTWLLNSFIFRSYNVVGGSMENTFHGGDRIIVNRLPVSLAHLKEKEYVPQRGQVIVFANGGNEKTMNCKAADDTDDKYIIKRVIAFPGERVTVRNGKLKIYNGEHPHGFYPDEAWRHGEDGPKRNVSGEVDVTVPEGELFVSGDNRVGANSLDSRNGLGTIPFCRVIGPAGMRIYPFNKVKVF